MFWSSTLSQVFQWVTPDHMERMHIIHYIEMWRVIEDAHVQAEMSKR